MAIELARQEAPALWRYRVRGANKELHAIVDYGFPSVGWRPQWLNHLVNGEEGPLPPVRRRWGCVAWYEAMVDGEWADLDGHTAYARPERAFEAALERIGITGSAPEMER